MGVRHTGLRAVLATVAAFGLGAGALVAAAGAQTAYAPGVTGKSVKLGYISSATGGASAVFRLTGKACQARIDRQNAQGGVNGRKIDLEMIDDQSSGANLTAAQDLVKNRNVFAVINNSSLAFLSYRYLLSQKVPVIGGGYDGTYYGQKGNESIFSGLGNTAPFDGLTYDTGAKVMKQLGGTKVAGLAYGVSPAGTAALRAFMNYAVPALRMKSAYTNTAIDFGATDVSPAVLGIKNSGADAVYLPMQVSTILAVIQGLEQNNVDMKAEVLATGYGQDLLDSPAASTLSSKTVTFQAFKPVELRTKATKQLQADLKKYAGVTDIPDFGTYIGYIVCDMAVTGLQHAGKNPTRQSFVDGLRNLGSYDAAGLTCKPIDISLTNYGKFPDKGCAYFMYVKNDKWVVMNKGKPYIGKLIGSPELLAANKSGIAPTTTAPPAS